MCMGCLSIADTMKDRNIGPVFMTADNDSCVSMIEGQRLWEDLGIRDWLTVTWRWKLPLIKRIPKEGTEGC